MPAPEIVWCYLFTLIISCFKSVLREWFEGSHFVLFTVLEEELLANLEDVGPPMSSTTPTKQPTVAAVPSFAGSVGSAQSVRSNGSSNSFRQRMEEILKANSAAVTSQPTHTAGGVETATTSEVSYTDKNCLRILSVFCILHQQAMCD